MEYPEKRGRRAPVAVLLRGEPGAGLVHMLLIRFESSVTVFRNPVTLVIVMFSMLQIQEILS